MSYLMEQSIIQDQFYLAPVVFCTLLSPNVASRLEERTGGIQQLSSVILNNQLEREQPSSKFRQETLAHIYNGILHGHKKEQNLP